MWISISLGIQQLSFLLASNVCSRFLEFPTTPPHPTTKTFLLLRLRLDHLAAHVPSVKLILCLQVPRQLVFGWYVYNEEYANKKHARYSFATVKKRPLNPKWCIHALTFICNEYHNIGSLSSDQTWNDQIFENRKIIPTLAQALAETVLLTEGSGLPVAIVRPSIVVAAWREPIPGKFISPSCKGFFNEKKQIFAYLFGTASVRSWSLDQPLVPGVFLSFFLRLLLFTHCGETPLAIFWHN